MRRELRSVWRLLVAMSVAFAVLPISAAGAGHGVLTPKAPYITLDAGVPAGSSVTPIISVGETVDGVLFEGLPDGIGATDGPWENSVDVYVNHEQTTVPFRNERDFQSATVTKLTLSTESGHEGEVLASEVVISAADGYQRFCSASMGTVAEGFDVPVFLTGEEANDANIAVPAGAPYGSDPSLAPARQGGYAVVLNTETGESTPVPGMGRLNHENTIALPGYQKLALLTTDDTFSGPSAQLYLYLVQDQEKLFADQGSLYAFQVTHDDDGRISKNDPFNEANDYIDLAPGEEFQGKFIPVPKNIAEGTTAVAPQQALEDWSNDHNVFQFLRLEDLAYDKNDPRVVYIADTGRSRVIPDPETGRLTRGPSGTVGTVDNGRIFKMVFDEKDPRKVVSFTVLADGDVAETHPLFVPMIAPDNIDTSVNSLMVQEDRDGAVIWRYDLAAETWSVVASVNNPDGESSGIVDASEWYGPGAWLLDVQSHGVNVDETVIDGITFRREDGQLMLMTIPGS